MQVGIKQVTACFTSLSSFGLTSLSRVFFHCDCVSEMGLFPWLANWNMPCLREFLSRLDALHLSAVPWPNTACSPEPLVLVLFFGFFLMKCDIDHLEGKTHEETNQSANRDEVGLSHLGMLFITIVFAKGWLLNLHPLPKGTLLISARSVRDG